MRTASVFSNNRSQAVRLPADMRFPADVHQVHIRAIGNERVLAPQDQLWDSFFLSTAPVDADFMAMRPDQSQGERESL